MSKNVQRNILQAPVPPVAAIPQDKNLENMSKNVQSYTRPLKLELFDQVLDPFPEKDLPAIPFATL